MGGCCSKDSLTRTKSSVTYTGMDKLVDKDEIDLVSPSGDLVAQQNTVKLRQYCTRDELDDRVFNLKIAERKYEYQEENNVYFKGIGMLKSVDDCYDETTEELLKDLFKYLCSMSGNNCREEGEMQELIRVRHLSDKVKEMCRFIYVHIPIFPNSIREIAIAEELYEHSTTFRKYLSDESVVTHCVETAVSLYLKRGDLTDINFVQLQVPAEFHQHIERLLLLQNLFIIDFRFLKDIYKEETYNNCAGIVFLEKADKKKLDNLPDSLKLLGIYFEGSRTKFYKAHSDDEANSEWMQAKLRLNSAIAMTLQVVTHYASIHLVLEPFTIASRRKLSELHPIWFLLNPHCSKIPVTNSLIWEILFSKENSLFEKITQYSASSISQLLASTANKRISTQFSLIEDLKKNGTIELNTSFIRNSIKCWNIIFSYVSNFIQEYYPHTNILSEDSEVQDWIHELRDKAGFVWLHQKWKKNGDNRWTLIGYLTSIVFFSTVLHSSIDSLHPLSFPLSIRGLSEGRHISDIVQLLPSLYSIKCRILIDSIIYSKLLPGVSSIIELPHCNDSKYSKQLAENMRHFADSLSSQLKQVSPGKEEKQVNDDYSHIQKDLIEATFNPSRIKQCPLF